VNTGIATWVKSLADFPLDPDRGQAWLWSGDGARLLWQSDAAAEALGAVNGHDPSAVSHAQSLESFALELGGAQPDRQPIRVKQVPLSLGSRSELFTCLCRHVPLADGGGYGLLTVAIGAPPRLAQGSAAAREEQRQPAAEAAPIEPPAAPPSATPIDLRQAARLELARFLDSDAAFAPEAAEAAPVVPEQQAQPAAATPVAVPSSGIAAAGPAWLNTSTDVRRPMRFVWQTDAEGRFVHLSRELAEAVGIAHAMILGKRLPEVSARLGLSDSGDAERSLAGTDTWTAKPLLWPVHGSDLGVPVELAGMPVREGGAFAGFRGYGIARIERAVPRSSSADAALSGDVAPAAEMREDRFGPGVVEALAKAGALPPRQVPAASQANVAAVAPSLLTVSERNAFREIARALGNAEPAPAAPIAAAPAETQAPPRQMPAWIARRQQARQDIRADAATAPAEVPEAANDAVVPFEAFQQRLDRRSRDPLQSAAPEMLDRVPAALLVMQQGRPVYANAAFLSFAGHADLSAFVAAGGSDAFFTAEPPGVDQRAANAIVVRRRDGKTVKTEAFVQAVSWDDAPASLMSFRLAGETAAASRADAAELELMSAKAELRELRFVLDTATDGVLSLDRDGRILAANRSAEALFGFDQREITGEPFTILLEPESHATALDYLQGLKADGVATIMNDGREVAGRERHGGRIPLFMTLGRMGGAGDAMRYCAVLRDVTIWKKAEAELQGARRAAESADANKSDFLARISHEIRTPMNAIIGFSDVMRNETFGPLGNDRYKGYVNDIHASGLHVVSLVNDLLDLSKVAAGKLDLTFGSVDINQAVSESVSMIQPQANAGKIIVRMQLAPKLPPVVADERSLRQIMLNLLSNAAKFTEPGGQVVVTTALTEKGEAAIRVRDTGIGMNPDEMARALEPFRQVSGPKAQGGTGLGLPLTKALAEANRAAFLISSEPGKGTLAEIVFPATRVLAE
jgi:PAS domain S-box-containing protein